MGVRKRFGLAGSCLIVSHRCNYNGAFMESAFLTGLYAGETMVLDVGL